MMVWKRSEITSRKKKVVKQDHRIFQVRRNPQRSARSGPGSTIDHRSLFRRLTLLAGFLNSKEMELLEQATPEEGH